MTKSELIKFIKEDCAKSDVKVIVENSDHVMAGGCPCSGYFDSDNKVIMLAKRAKGAKMIMVHEYCHFLQWKEQCEAWVNYMKYNDEDYFTPWLANEVEIEKDKLDLIIRSAAELELDCEKRAVSFAKEKGIDFDLDRYTKQANAYVLSYKIVHRFRKWNIPGSAPHNDNNVVEMMPSEFVTFDYELSNSQVDAFLKCY